MIIHDCSKLFKEILKLLNSVRLNCEAKGIPKPDYYWYKDGEKIFDNSNRSPMVGLENALNFQGSLLLQKVAWKDRNCFKPKIGYDQVFDQVKTEVLQALSYSEKSDYGHKRERFYM